MDDERNMNTNAHTCIKATIIEPNLTQESLQVVQFKIRQSIHDLQEQQLTRLHVAFNGFFSFSELAGKSIRRSTHLVWNISYLRQWSPSGSGCDDSQDCCFWTVWHQTSCLRQTLAGCQSRSGEASEFHMVLLKKKKGKWNADVLDFKCK